MWPFQSSFWFSILFFPPKVFHLRHCVSLVFTTWNTSLNFTDNPFVILLHRVFVRLEKHNTSTSLKWDIIPEYNIYSEYSTELGLYLLRCSRILLLTISSCHHFVGVIQCTQSGQKIFLSLLQKIFLTLWICKISFH